MFSLYLVFLHIAKVSERKRGTVPHLIIKEEPETFHKINFKKIGNREILLIDLSISSVIAIKSFLIAPITVFSHCL